MANPVKPNPDPKSKRVYPTTPKVKRVREGMRHAYHAVSPRRPK